jgi:hypothetical protein
VLPASPSTGLWPAFSTLPCVCCTLRLLSHTLHHPLSRAVSGHACALRTAKTPIDERVLFTQLFILYQKCFLTLHQQITDIRERSAALAAMAAVQSNGSRWWRGERDGSGILHAYNRTRSTASSRDWMTLRLPCFSRRPSTSNLRLLLFSSKGLARGAEAAATARGTCLRFFIACCVYDKLISLSRGHCLHLTAHW